MVSAVMPAGVVAVIGRHFAVYRDGAGGGLVLAALVVLVVAIGFGILRSFDPDSPQSVAHRLFGMLLPPSVLLIPSLVLASLGILRDTRHPPGSRGDSADTVAIGVVTGGKLPACHDEQGTHMSADVGESSPLM
ncbi:MAG: hypothetical protein U9R47_00875 [Actinomycetota bacterium]|nr:hypothetical protein [Actinomycetota bacterium]